MNLRWAIFAATTALSGVTLVATASGDEYFDAMERLTGTRYTVEAICSGDEYSTQLTDEADGANYLYLYAPEPISDDWTETVEKCRGGEAVSVELEVYLTYGSIGWRFAGIAKSSAKAMSILDVATAVTDELASVDEISGWIVEGVSDLNYTGLGPRADGDATYVYHDYMPKRTTIAYLNECFDVCPKVRFSLEPIVVSPGGGYSYLYASGWSMVEGEEEPEDGGKDKDR